jgi:hypothetical protein
LFDQLNWLLSTAQATAIVTAAVLVWQVLVAPWKVHKEDQAQIERLKNEVAELRARADDQAFQGVWATIKFAEDGTPHLEVKKNVAALLPEGLPHPIPSCLDASLRRPDIPR